MHLDSHGNIKPHFLGSDGKFARFDPAFDRFLKQCAKRDQDKFWEYFKKKYSLPMISINPTFPLYPGE